FYSVSTLVCTQASLAQEVGTALGAQAGEARLRDVLTRGGVTRVRRAAGTPFNILLGVKPESAVSRGARRAPGPPFRARPPGTPPRIHRRAGAEQPLQSPYRSNLR